MSEPDIYKDNPLNVAFPLPYRVLLLIGIGLLGWATNLHGLHALEIDSISALDLKSEEYPPRLPITHHRYLSFNVYAMAPSIYQSVYRVLLGYSGFCLSSWFLYRWFTKSDPALVDAYGYIPGLTALILILVLFCPYDICYKTEREKFTQCFFSSINTPIQFSDVVFADIGTSFAKVIGDIWLSLCMLLPGNTLLIPPPQNGLSRWILPTLMSLPYFARFRQCVIEHNLSSSESSRPLFNAIKYATAFPVIYLSAAQRLVVEEIVKESGEGVANEPWHGEHQLFRMWLLAVFINSVYSFWWDVTNDWGMDLLKSEAAIKEEQIPHRPFLPRLHSGTPLISRTSIDSTVEAEFDPSFRPSEPLKIPSQSYPYGLRSTLLYPLAVYPLLIFLNFVLRMAWSIKLSTHLHTASDGSFPMLWLEVAEIIRRWLWVFIRVEWEVIKKAQEDEPRKEESNRDDDTSGFELLPPTKAHPQNLLD